MPKDNDGTYLNVRCLNSLKHKVSQRFYIQPNLPSSIKAVDKLLSKCKNSRAVFPDATPEIPARGLLQKAN